jgi:aspartyl-tRNA(Asn)/glutamyl-tRNA(Gln) amidotransferase subunit A
VSTTDAQWLTVREAGQLIRGGDLSPVELTTATLDWIEKTQDVTKAFVCVMADEALEAAETAERELREGIDRGPFHGITYSVKDLIAVKGVEMEVNSKLTAGFIPSEDATVIKKMREAGAVCLGKVATHEFAWGCVSPPAKNPWDGASVPGGSSGGSGAAVAGGQGAASIGTDCACSVRNPAALNGVSGIRPTHGRVSTTGVVPVSLGMDTVGPLCRTVEDTAIMLSIMSGHDPADRSTSSAPVPEWASDITQSIEGLTVGVPTNFFFDHMEPGVQAAVEGAVATFQDLGLKIREIEIPHAHWAGDAFFVMCLVETAVLHDDWLHTRASEFGLDLRAAAELGNLLLAKDYVRAQQIRSIIIREWEQAFENSDLVIVPASAATSKTLRDHPRYVDVEYPDGYVEDILFAYTRPMTPISLAGVPSLVVPCGFSSDGLPVGMQIVAPAFDEGTAFRAGHAYQQATDWHVRRPTKISEVGTLAR